MPPLRANRPIETLLAGTSDIAYLIMKQSGQGNHMNTLEKMRSLSQRLYKGQLLKLYLEQRKKKDDFSEGLQLALKHVGNQSDVTSLSEAIQSYMGELFVFGVIQDLVQGWLFYGKVHAPQPDKIRDVMINARQFLEDCNWAQFCVDIKFYEEFDDILDDVIFHVLDVVVDEFHRFSSIIVVPGGLTQQEYSDQQRRILGNMGDAGVLQCLWTVSKKFKLQETLLRLFPLMMQSRSMEHVKDIMKTPGNMAVMGNVLLKMNAGEVNSNEATDYYRCVMKYASIVNAMLSSDQVFPPSEEIVVVEAVHTFIARWSNAGIMTERVLCMLLESICTRTRDSTLRQLTNAQIDFLCNHPLVRSVPVAREYVSTLLYRTLAANKNYDTSGIDPFFIRSV
jgi:hypothetical protein